MAQVVVTGGGGFIGSHLIGALLTRGDEVTVIDLCEDIPWRLSHLSGRGNLRYVAADVRDRQKCEEAIPGSCSKIFHLAAVVGVRNYCSDPLETIDTNIGGLRTILGAALLRGSKIIFASTSEVYGKNSKVPLGEDSDRVLGPTSIDRWSYGSSKAICEHMLFATHRKHSLPMVIVRLFNAYGPRQKPIFAIPAMIDEVVNGRGPRVYDSGEQTRCFTFADDVIEGILRASERPLAEGQAFNIGSSQEITMASLARKVIDVGGKSGELEPRFVDTKGIYRSYEDPSRRVPGVSRAKEVLGWAAKTSLDTGLRKTFEFVRMEIDKERR